MKKFVEFLKKIELFIEFLKGGLDMAIIYTTLIIKGYKKFSDVPNSLKDKVREILEQLDCADLILD